MKCGFCVDSSLLEWRGRCEEEEEEGVCVPRLCAARCRGVCVEPF